MSVHTAECALGVVFGSLAPLLSKTGAYERGLIMCTCTSTASDANEPLFTTLVAWRHNKPGIYIYVIYKELINN